MLWEQCFFARATGYVPADVVHILTSQGEHDFLGRLQGLAIRKEYTEAFETAAARDSALGLYGRLVQFVATDWEEHLQAGFDFTNIAVGHAIGEAGFERLAGALVDVHARTLTRSRKGREVVLARCRYWVSARHDGVVSVDAMGEFGVNRDNREVTATMRWLREAFAMRIAKSPPVGG